MRTQRLSAGKEREEIEGHGRRREERQHGGIELSSDFFGGW